MVFLLSFVLRLSLTVVAFVLAMLLVFLILGQCSTLSAYLEVYLADIAYNSLLPLFKLVSGQSNNTIKKTLFRLGYYGVCMVEDGAEATSCTDYGSLESVNGKIGIRLGNLTTLLMVDIAVGWHQLIHYQLVIAVIIATLLFIIMLLWLLIPRVPKRFETLIAATGLGFITIVLLGATAMVHHAAISGAMGVVKASLAGVMAMTRGVRANAMTWTALIMLLILVVLVGFSVVRTRMLAQAQTKRDTL